VPYDDDEAYAKICREDADRGMRNGAGIPSGGQRRREQGAAADCVPVRLSRCSAIAIAAAGLLLPEGFSRYRPEPG
jgi:hypothetical protein